MSDTKQLWSFGLIVGGIFALIGLWPAVWRGQPLRLWSLILGGTFIVLALAWPRSLTHVYRLWMTVGEVLGWINTRIILGVLFYLLFTPHGILAAETESYRVVRQPRPSSHMLHQF